MAQQFTKKGITWNYHRYWLQRDFYHKMQGLIGFSMVFKSIILTCLYVPILDHSPITSRNCNQNRTKPCCDDQKQKGAGQAEVSQSDEGCRKDLFKTSQKKGVGYLLLITAFQYFPIRSVRRVQRKMPLHVTSVMTALCNGSTLQSPHITWHPQKQRLSTRSTGRKKSPQSTRMVCLHA